ncbi:NADP dehydrogenase [ubiquinone] iron-sulfur protein 6, mitochondrial [Plakobranchus ocellatus]|uniref:NADP dehydrogenase [ubiquinone] iron-sulfur protein 6, mitochondrial n=1 Tax=Plakobranchus ocellatus TaxID=259542 RepID=A0AAV3ZM11_9GAST|nr:NADP dehydrogenase [ubiquinone] iron-sulfur protein 6, mitochondrial [Plakobranchus ocellatus]
MATKLIRVSVCLHHAKGAVSVSLLRNFSQSIFRTINEGSNYQKPTHTGQLWDKDDYRNIRFVDRDKHINPMWAVELINEDPVVVVQGNHVWSHSCGALGHPKVYINLCRPKDDHVVNVQGDDDNHFHNGDDNVNIDENDDDAVADDEIV